MDMMLEFAAYVGCTLAVLHLRESRWEGVGVLMSSVLVSYALFAATSEGTAALGEDTRISCRSVAFITVQLYASYFFGSRIPLSKATKHFARAFCNALFRCTFDSLGMSDTKFGYLGVPTTTLTFHFLLGIMFSISRGFIRSLLHDYRQPSMGSRLQQLPQFFTATVEVLTEVVLVTAVTPVLSFAPLIIADIIIPSFLYDRLEMTMTAMGFAVFVAAGAAVFSDPVFGRFTAASFSVKKKKDGVVSTLFSSTNLTGGDRDLILLLQPCVLLVFETIVNTFGLWQDFQLTKRLLVFMWIALSYFFFSYLSLCGMLTLSGEQEDNISFNIPLRRGSGKRDSPRWTRENGAGAKAASSTPMSKSQELRRRKETPRSGGDRSSSGSDRDRDSKGSRSSVRSGLSRRSPSMEIMELSMSSPARQMATPLSSSPDEDKVK